MADRVVAASLKSNSKWGSRDRSFIAENTYEVIRWWRLLKFCAEINQRKIEDEPCYWKLLGTWLILKGYQLPEWPEFSELKPEIILTMREQTQTIRKIRESIPDWLDETGEKEVPDWDKEIHEMNREAEVFIRVNELKIKGKALIEKLREEGIELVLVPDVPNALRLASRKNLTSSESYRQGLFEIQDAGSQLIADFVKALPGEQILDGCAGAGGKSLSLAQNMNNDGQIIATDISWKKLTELELRAQRNGITIIKTERLKTFETGKYKEWADKILLDVPCSGSGVLRRNPDTKWKLKPAFLEDIKATQAAILDRNIQFLKPDGELIYATCSLFRSENEDQIRNFLSRNPEFELLEEKRISPAQTGFDGYYMARVKRKNPN